MSPSGVRLNNLTGIAAILRFVLPQLDEMVEADEGDIDSEEESKQDSVAEEEVINEEKKS